MLPLEKPWQVGQTTAWHGEIPTYNIYTFGIAGERFFRELKEHGRFLGTRCPACALTYMPPRIYCERCFASLEEWVEVPGRGTVFTFTLAYYDLDGHRMERPDILALVRLEGAHGGILHRLGEVHPSQVSIGMQVEAVLKPPQERQGSILDILYFRPA
ncbi:MAG: Zn-ribbon domain-containing OB-fold protein [Dehalococcoidia bacterium]